MYFTFEHECDNAPMTLTIYVEYSIWTWPCTHDQPAECEINRVTYTATCGKLDMTEIIKSNSDDKLQDEIEEAITVAIWNDYNNQ